MLMRVVKGLPPSVTDIKAEYRLMHTFFKSIKATKMVINENEMQYMQFGDDARHVTVLHDHDGNDHCVTQSNQRLYPLPFGDFTLTYYEVEVEFDHIDSAPCIGIALEHYSNAMPGWGPDSFGFHGDDGKIFLEKPLGDDLSSPWTSGDIVGFGIDFFLGELFVTHNGFRMDIPVTRISWMYHYFATIGFIQSGASVKINFGHAPFVYDLVEHMDERNRKLVLEGMPVPTWIPFSDTLREIQIARQRDAQFSPEQFEGLKKYSKVTNTRFGVTNVGDKTRFERDMLELGSILEWLASEDVARALGNESGRMDPKEVQAAKEQMDNLVDVINSDHQVVDPQTPYEEKRAQVAVIMLEALSSMFVDFVIRREEFFSQRRAQGKSGHELMEKDENADPAFFRKLPSGIMPVSTLFLIINDDHLFPSDHPLLVPLMRLCDEMFGTQIVDNGPDRNTERGDMLVTLSQAAAMIFVQYESEHLFRRLKTSFSERNDLLYRVLRPDRKGKVPSLSINAGDGETPTLRSLLYELYDAEEIQKFPFCIELEDTLNQTFLPEELTYFYNLADPANALNLHTFINKLEDPKLPHDDPQIIHIGVEFFRQTVPFLPYFFLPSLDVFADLTRLRIYLIRIFELFSYNSTHMQARFDTLKFAAFVRDVQRGWFKFEPPVIPSEVVRSELDVNVDSFDVPEWDDINYGDYLLIVKRMVIDGEGLDEMDLPRISLDTLRKVLIGNLAILHGVSGPLPSDVAADDQKLYDYLIANYTTYFDAEGRKFIVDPFKIPLDDRDIAILERGGDIQEHLVSRMRAQARGGGQEIAPPWYKRLFEWKNAALVGLSAAVLGALAYVAFRNRHALRRNG